MIDIETEKPILKWNFTGKKNKNTIIINCYTIFKISNFYIKRILVSSFLELIKCMKKIIIIKKFTVQNKKYTYISKHCLQNWKKYNTCYIL